MIAKCIKGIFVFLIILYANIVYSIEVPETDNQPVRLNDNEILFPGGWKEEKINSHGQGIKTVVPARIYNIKEKRFIDLNSQMKIPRNNYVASKYGNKVLIAGGWNINYKLSKTVEIYDIEKNQFEQINDSVYTHWDQWSRIFTLKDNRIYLMHCWEAEIFNPADNSFSLASDRDITNSNGSKLKPTGSAVLLKDDRIAKFYGKNFDIYNPQTNKIEIIPTPKDIRISNPALILNNGNLLLIGWNNGTGPVFEFNPTNNEFTKIAELNPSVTWTKMTLMDNDTVLMTRGVIKIPDISFISYDRGKCFSSALYSISQKKIYRMKNASCNFKGREYVFKLDDKSAIIFVTNKKPIIYKI